MKKSEAAQVFQVSRNTINLWLKRRAETGDLQPKSNRPQRTTNKITDWDHFAQRIEQCWAWLKSRIRQRLSHSGSLRQTVESVLRDAVS